MPEPSIWVAGSGASRAKFVAQNRVIDLVVGVGGSLLKATVAGVVIGVLGAQISYD